MEKVANLVYQAGQVMVITVVGLAMVMVEALIIVGGGSPMKFITVSCMPNIEVESLFEPITTLTNIVV